MGALSADAACTEETAPNNAAASIRPKTILREDCDRSIEDLVIRRDPLANSGLTRLEVQASTISTGVRFILNFPPVSRSLRSPERRILPVSARPGEGHLTEPVADVQPARRELVFMPRSCPSRPRRRIVGPIEERTFAPEFCIC